MKTSPELYAQKGRAAAYANKCGNQLEVRNIDHWFERAIKRESAPDNVDKAHAFFNNAFTAIMYRATTTSTQSTGTVFQQLDTESAKCQKQS